VPEVGQPLELGDEPAEFLRIEYQHMDGDHGPGIAGAIRHIAATGSQPLAFHCAAGQDRTGLAAAVLLRCLAMNEDDVVEDVTLSEPARSGIAA
jgi:protein-tyrosine phosphatase